MKRILVVLAALALLFASCSKENTTDNTGNGNNNNNNNNQNTAASLKWTYLGANFTGDSLIMSKPDTIPGTSTYWPYYEFQGTASSTTLHVGLKSISTGTYTDQGGHFFHFGNHAVDAFTISVTSSSGNKISGSFTATDQGNTINGTFANIAFN